VQTGVGVDAELWQAYRLLCRREKLRPSRPMEEFLRFMVDADSVMRVLSLMGEATKARGGGFDAYARVLLDWYTHGKFWFSVPNQEDNELVEPLLLEALKSVSGADLRKRIEEALIARNRELRSEESRIRFENPLLG
jgi:hypothetical protein